MNEYLRIIDDNFLLFLLGIVSIYWIFFAWPLIRKNNRKKPTIWDYLILGPMVFFIKQRQKQSKLDEPFFSKFALFGIFIFLLIVIGSILYEKKQYDSGAYDGTRYGRQKY